MNTNRTTTATPRARALLRPQQGQRAPGLRWLTLLCLALLLGGCAQVRYTLHLDPDYRNNTPQKYWPAAPEQARYAYVGQLLGQDNLVSEDANQRNIGVKVLHWLVGLFDGSEEKITLKRPQSGVVDDQGRVLVTDVSNHAVFVFDQAGGTLQVWEMAEQSRRFVTPIGIAVGANGQILVADAELGQVFRLDREGKPLGSFGRGLLTRPTGLARDAARGHVYVADTHAHDIKVFDDAGVWLHTIARRGEGEDGLNFPTHLAFAQGRLLVADSMNARIQIFDADGRFLQTLGQRGLNKGNLTRPKGVTVDSGGNIYVVESFFDTLLVFNQGGEFLMPLGGTGQEVGQFYLPSGLWSDDQGRVYVADMFNGRVVIFQFLGGS
jgi:DNA-binding beta-propeller fold protein YncE